MAPQARVTAVERLGDAAHWRAAAVTLEWRAAAMALEAKFVAARKDAGEEAPTATDSGAATGANDNWRNQPRAPAGSPEGGQWVSGASAPANDNSTGGLTDTRVISDAYSDIAQEGQ